MCKPLGQQRAGGARAPSALERLWPVCHGTLDNDSRRPGGGTGDRGAGRDRQGSEPALSQHTDTEEGLILGTVTAKYSSRFWALRARGGVGRERSGEKHQES